MIVAIVCYVYIARYRFFFASVFSFFLFVYIFIYGTYIGSVFGGE